MVEVIAKKRIGRKKAGETVRLTSVEARAVVALGMAEYKTRALTAAVAQQAAPKVVAAKPKTYATRALKTD